MGVTYQTKTQSAVKQLNKLKGKAKTAAEKLMDPTEEAVTRMAVLKPQMDAHKPIAAEYEKCRKFLAGAIPEDASEMEPVTFKNETHEVVFSACAKKRTVANMKKLHTLLGDKVFYDLVEIPLKELDKYVAEVEQASIVVETYTGARTHEVHELPKTE